MEEKLDELIANKILDSSITDDGLMKRYENKRPGYSVYNKTLTILIMNKTHLLK